MSIGYCRQHPHSEPVTHLHTNQVKLHSWPFVFVSNCHHGSHVCFIFFLFPTAIMEAMSICYMPCSSSICMQLFSYDHGMQVAVLPACTAKLVKTGMLRKTTKPKSSCATWHPSRHAPSRATPPSPAGSGIALPTGEGLCPAISCS